MNKAELLASSHRVVVKVGSAVLTDKHGLDRRRVDLLAAQICRLADQGRQVVFVSSGSIATGRAKAGLNYRPKALPEKQACAALGQSGLMQAYEEAFARHGRKVAQILLTAADLTRRNRYTNARNTLETLLDWGVIPIVNENDTVSTAEIKLGDNDNLAAMLTNLLGARVMISLTNVDGVMDADPRMHPNAKLIPVVEQVDVDLLSAASSQPGAVGLGGIFSKVRAADKVARCGSYTIVANGLVDDVIDLLLKGQDLGTLFLPRAFKLTSRKHWIAFTASRQGELLVDKGAVPPLTEYGKSLLPAGITEVRGDFQAGQAVKVLGPDDSVLGVGLSNYSSREVDAIKGLHSNEIAEKLGHDAPEEVIHRDNLVVFDQEEEESVACLLNN
ncbi:glutamate 5-kinase [Dethiosulfatarculus sandiegensis]|uniref:Glutamate 5-kinase n=1 Tax=Dethiosulfatarculus sandiegensis TaxID=1429043 RepID=A0A0D2IZA4_9BACT|nr:glutamate 5-kinase [Dethiosulfatarculus sandiegensis]KIX11364.1 gamma-glutamyl kinase [Dethiosulfatarculus sandiegensis]